MSKECMGCGTWAALIMVNGASVEEYDEAKYDTENRKFNQQKTARFAMKFKRLCAICFCNRALGFRLTEEQLKLFNNGRKD
jgi:hypothetical protein